MYPPDDDEDYLFKDVTYKPCKFCGTMDYDMADGEPDKQNNFTPRTCDQCNFGDVLNSKTQIH
jgi:hypothetical protein